MASTLDKVTLNNKIVLMRHDVQRARVLTVHKLVKDVRMLRAKKGSDEQKEKYSKKAERLLEEVKILKTLKNDQISRFTLTNEENPTAILSNVIGKTTEERVLARLSMNKVLIASLNEFKTKYPNWSEEIPALLPHLGKRSKKQNLKKQVDKLHDKKSSATPAIKNKKTVENKISNETNGLPKKISVKKQKLSEGKTPNETSDMPVTEKNIVIKNKKAGENVSDETNYFTKKSAVKKRKLTEDKITNETNDLLVTKKNIKFKNKKVGENNFSDDTNCSKISTKKSEVKKQKTKLRGNIFSVETSSVSKRDIVENKSLDEKIISTDTKDIIKKNRDRAEVIDDKRGKEIKVVDPFFLGGDDSAYITIATNEKQVEALQNSTLSTFGFDKINKRKEFKTFDRHNNFNNKEKILGRRGRELETRGPCRRERREQMRMGIAPRMYVEEQQEKLHPSWEAKKKLSCPPIAQFAGKKVVFDDD